MLQPVKWAAAAVLALAVEVAAASAPGMPAALPLRRTLSGRPAAGASAARARPDLRILKPLRGGGGGDDEAVSAPVMVTFSVECHQTTVGESIGIVGSCAELGNWQDIAVMNPQEWPCWSLEVQMHELHSDIEFKYVKVRKDGHVAQWERGHNRKMSLENPPAKDLFVDGGQFGDGQAYDTQPVKKPSNLVPGCVARVRSYPKMAALSAEATQSEAEAVAQEASTAKEADEQEKTGMRSCFCAPLS